MKYEDFKNRIQLNKPGTPGKPPVFKILDSGLPIDEVMRNYNFMVKSQWIVRSFIDLMQRSYYTCCYRYLVPNVNFLL